MRFGYISGIGSRQRSFSVEGPDYDANELSYTEIPPPTTTTTSTTTSRCPPDNISGWWRWRKISTVGDGTRQNANLPTYTQHVCVPCSTPGSQPLKNLYSNQELRKYYMVGYCSPDECQVLGAPSPPSHADAWQWADRMHDDLELTRNQLPAEWEREGKRRSGRLIVVSHISATFCP